MSTPDLLVTGASGKLGRRVLHHLLTSLDIPAHRIAAATRTPESLSDWAARGISVRKADFEDSLSLADAFRDIPRLLLISTDALERPGRRLAQHRAAIEAAVRAGVAHIVYTSLPNAETSSIAFAPDHAGTEKALAESSLPGWTVLRNNWYFENLFFSLPSTLASGRWYSAAGEGRIAHIARDDLALAAATALAGTGSAKTILTLGGERAYTRAEIAELVAGAIGRKIAMVPVPTEGLVQGMVSHGLSEPLARIFASFDSEIAAGGLADVTGDFAALTGRKPQAFEDWLAENRPALLS